MEVPIKAHLGCLVDLYVPGNAVSNISKWCWFFFNLHLLKKKKNKSEAYYV